MTWYVSIHHVMKENLIYLRLINTKKIPRSLRMSDKDTFEGARVDFQPLRVSLVKGTRN
jgi:hypothetical protein